MKCGLLRRKLGHSYSPQIHAFLGEYPYTLFEKEPEDIENFLTSGDFTAINVTIPYKKVVIPYCSTLTDCARRMNAVNTIIRQSDGSLLGHNTDYFGFTSMVHHSGLNPNGKKAIVLGSGGASNTAVIALEDMGAEVIVISHKENTTENLLQYKDAKVIVNATPVGMYPNNGNTPVNLDLFPQLEGVLDMIYNPARTKLLLDAEKRGLIAENGLWMLVAQAKEAAEWFLNQPLSDTLIKEIHQALTCEMENITLIGMPGCGKTHIGRILAQRLGKEFVDVDKYIEDMAGISIPQIFSESGEEVFRRLETEALDQLGKCSGLVIATGGGCVTRSINYPLLHQNSKIVWIQREIESLATDGRPLSQSGQLQAMYEVRSPLYEAFSDHIISNNATPNDAAELIIIAMHKEAIT